MSEAFKCDKCKKLYDSLPMNDWIEEKLAWAPDRNSYPIHVKIEMRKMRPDTDATILEYPDLCKECFATIVRFAADKIYMPGAVAIASQT